MSKLRASLTAIMDSETKDSTYYRIAHYLLENNYIKKRISIQDIADNCFCAKSTISRFCRQIGYEDFVELNTDMYMSSIKSQDKYNRYFSDSFEGTKKQFFMDLEQCICQAEAGIKEMDVKELAADIFHFKTVGIFGNVQSQTVAKMFQEDLGLSRKIVTAPLLPYNQQLFIQQADENTLIIVVSCSGRFFPDYIRKDEFTHGKRPKICLVTVQEKMIGNKVYDKVVCIPCENNYISRPRILDIFLNMVAIEYAHLVNENEQ